jgi:hypothetical protein
VSVCGELFYQPVVGELIIPSTFRGLQPCPIFDLVAGPCLAPRSSRSQWRNGLEGKAWRAVTHHATRFSSKGASSLSAISEDAGCAKYECPHVWIGSALTRSNPTLTATSIPHFSRGDTSHMYQMKVQKRLGSLTRDEDLLFTCTCTYTLFPSVLAAVLSFYSRHPGCSGFGLKILDGRLIAPFLMS